MNIIRLTFVLVIVALIVGLSACDRAFNEFTSLLSGDDMPQLEGLSGEIPIGVLYPITGRLNSVGVRMKHGFELALEEINSAQLGNARLVFITEDDRGTVDGAIEAFEKLIDQDGVPVILGPTSSSQSQVAFPIAQQNGVVALSPTSGASGLSALGDFIFRVTLTADVLIPNSVKVTREQLGYQRVAIIYDAIDIVSQSSYNGFTKALTENGVEILTREAYQTGDTDFSNQLTKIKALNPDAIFIAALPPDMPGIMIQGRELGIPASIPFIVAQVTIDEIQAAGPAAEGLLFSTGWFSTASTPGNQVFVQNYRAAYGIEPNAWAAQSYAAVYILAEAIANAKSTDSTEIRDALANITDFDTILGQFSFDRNGDAVYDPTILVVVNGQFEVFE